MLVPVNATNCMFYVLYVNENAKHVVFVVLKRPFAVRRLKIKQFTVLKADGVHFQLCLLLVVSKIKFLMHHFRYYLSPKAYSTLVLKVPGEAVIVKCLKSLNCTRSLTEVMAALKPLFEMDIYITRSIVASLNVSELVSVFKTNWIPIEVACATTLHWMKTTKASWKWRALEYAYTEEEKVILLF